jgi:hypothetical protein
MPAPSIAFTIADAVPQDAQEAVIAAVGFVDGVRAVQRIAPDSTIPAVRRMCVATLVEGPGAPDPAEVAERIRALPGIAGADLPPDRGLV